MVLLTGGFLEVVLHWGGGILIACRRGLPGGTGGWRKHCIDGNKEILKINLE